MECEIDEGYIVADSRNGIYCPQVFAERVERFLFPQISKESWDILESGPDNERYWDAWIYDFEGQVSIEGGSIYHDGDVWIVYEFGDDEE